MPTREPSGERQSLEEVLSRGELERSFFNFLKVLTHKSLIVSEYVLRPLREPQNMNLDNSLYKGKVGRDPRDLGGNFGIP